MFEQYLFSASFADSVIENVFDPYSSILLIHTK